MVNPYVNIFIKMISILFVISIILKKKQKILKINLIQREKTVVAAAPERADVAVRVVRWARVDDHERRLYWQWRCRRGLRLHEGLVAPERQEGQSVRAAGAQRLLPQLLASQQMDHRHGARVQPIVGQERPHRFSRRGGGRGLVDRALMGRAACDQRESRAISASISASISARVSSDHLLSDAIDLRVCLSAFSATMSP